MKKKIIVGSIIIVIGAFCLFYFMILKNKANLVITEGVEVVPTMNDKITSDSVWCGTFQLVWNDMLNELLGDNVQELSKLDIVTNLNKMDFNTSMISEEYYYKKFGPKTLKLKKEIEQGVKDKFNQKSDILDSFNWNDDELSSSSKDRYFFYTMLYRVFEYNKKFSVLEEDKFGKYDNIKYFGVKEGDNEDIRNQIEVLFYTDKDNFAIKLHTKNNDEVILYKSPNGNTFNEIYNNLIEKTKKYIGTKNFNNNDTFKAPIINLNIKKEYNELSNIVFNTKDNKEITIDTAVQTINFSLDETGGKIKSEAALDIKTTLSPVEEEARYFNVNNTFALFLKEESKEKPYFAAKIEDITKYQN